MKPTEQQEIIINSKRNAVVIAAPGSGKTFVISQKIKSNLKSLKDHEGVIAISYTNKASNELKSRSLSNGENPKSSFFGTIDKFNIMEILIPFGKLLFGMPNGELKIIKKNSLEAFEVENLTWIDRDISLRTINNRQFDVLIEYFLQGTIFIETIGFLSYYVLINSNACRNYIKSKYRNIYIDEYQDSGEHQHKIFLILKDLNLKAVAVGDLNQSIFAFSGKKSVFLDELSKSSDFKYFILDKNHRCHPSVINYSNYLLNAKTQLIPNVESVVFHMNVKGTEKEIAKFIDKKLTEIKRAFDLIENNQIGILVRSSRTGNILKENLSTPCRFYLGNDLELDINIWSVIFSKLLYYIFDPAYKFIEVIEVFTSYERLNRKELSYLKTCKENLEFFREKKTNLPSLKAEMIKIATLIAPDLKNVESIQLLDEVLDNENELNSYKPASKDELIIMTLHKSKGLEFDLVIHLDLYEWILPKKSPAANNDFSNITYSDYFQDLNLHYVGITRAIKGCILLTSSQRTNAAGEIKNAKDSEFMSLNGIKKLIGNKPR